MKDWKQQLDARIDRCPGCDQWRWDGKCQLCTGVVDSDSSDVRRLLHPVARREEAA